MCEYKDSQISYFFDYFVSLFVRICLHLSAMTTPIGADIIHATHAQNAISRTCRAYLRKTPCGQGGVPILGTINKAYIALYQQDTPFLFLFFDYLLTIWHKKRRKTAVSRPSLHTYFTLQRDTTKIVHFIAFVNTFTKKYLIFL